MKVLDLPFMEMVDVCKCIWVTNSGLVSFQLQLNLSSINTTLVRDLSGFVFPSTSIIQIPFLSFFSLISSLHGFRTFWSILMASANSGATLVNTGAVPTSEIPINSEIPFYSEIPINSGTIPNTIGAITVN